MGKMASKSSLIKWAGLIRWAARVWSILPIFWAFSEILYPHVDPDAEITIFEQISLVLLYISVGGLIMAWVKERAGALISLGSMALFVVVFLTKGFDSAVLIFIAGLGVPAGLFMLAWYIEDLHSQAGDDLDIKEGV